MKNVTMTASHHKGALLRLGELNDLGGRVGVEFLHPCLDPAKIAGCFGEHQPVVTVGGGRLQEPRQVRRSPVDGGDRRPRQQMAAAPQSGRCVLNL